ncbi:MAG: PTS transporter subunit EIIA [Nitrospiraceae bacterium]|nr:PTS transporter subunit EIIA [Nitrospiraceae bacterium]
MSAFGTEIDPRCVCIFDGAKSKSEALDVLVALAADTGALADATAFREAIRTRENTRSTGIGSGVAIPHARLATVLRSTIVVGLSAEGIAFEAVDDQSVNIVVLFAMPEGADKLYLQLLAQAMLALKTPGFSERLLGCRNAADAADVLNAFNGRARS